MPIPNPDLDNKSFAEIVEEAKKKIVTYSPLWTDHNASDPGITLLELFGWLAEAQLYSLNRIREKNYHKFVQLLGVKPSKAVPAEMVISIIPSKVAHSINKGSILESVASSDQTVIFETLEDSYVAPITIGMTGTFSQVGFRDEAAALENSDAYFYAFGEKPRVGNCFYIGLSTEKDFKIQDLSKVDPVSFYINLYSDTINLNVTHDE
jgi:predicted phage baseplate assembly protein